jgi:rare lipoprotein A
MQLRFQPWQGIALFLFTSLLILSGCSSVPVSTSPVADASSKRQSIPATGARRLPALPPAGSGRGGYYQDDGPGDSPPDGLHDLPDAEPKVEPYSKRGNRPYVVFGKTYTPMTDERPFKQRGRGSWYGKKFHGQKTSSGEIYDMYKMTAAHPTLPIPSYARVTNVSNGKQVIVRVNDRGPFHSSRIMDLSYTAALKLDYVAKGSAELEIERLLPEEIERIAGNKQQGRPDNAPSLSAVPVTAAEAESRPDSNLIAAAQPISVEKIFPAPLAPSALPAVNGSAASGFYLQLGAYAQADNAEAARSRLTQNWAAALPALEVRQHATLYRIYSGPFATRAEADSAAQQVEILGAKPVVVQR